jgi:hypothetical protein
MCQTLIFNLINEKEVQVSSIGLNILRPRLVSCTIYKAKQTKKLKRKKKVRCKFMYNYKGH